MKHLEELKNLKIDEGSKDSKPTLVAPESFISNHNDETEHRVSKAQKRREKKNEKERERQAEVINIIKIKLFVSFLLFKENRISYDLCFILFVTRRSKKSKS